MKWIRKRGGAGRQIAGRIGEAWNRGVSGVGIRDYMTRLRNPCRAHARGLCRGPDGCLLCVVKETSQPDFTANIARFTGFAQQYDSVRPSPPADLAALLRSYAGGQPLQLVVDLGSGTGLSTRFWARHAERVIGIEPTEAMRKQAEAATDAPSASYQAGWSHATGLPSASADVVCCSQALHWMEPAGTFREARRILRPGGVFAAVDFDWPPAVGIWEVERAYEECVATVHRLEMESGVRRTLRHWEKSGHLERMAASGCFRYIREVLLQHEESGNADRWLGVLLSQGSVQTLLKQGRSPAELGLDVFRATTERLLGAQPRPWHWSARVRLGIV